MVPYTFLLVAGVSAASQCEIDTDVISMIQAGKASVGKTGDPWYKEPMMGPKTVFIKTDEPEPIQVKVYPRTTAGHIKNEHVLSNLLLDDHEFEAADMGENFHGMFQEGAHLVGKPYEENICGKCEWHDGSGSPAKSLRFAGGLMPGVPLHDHDFQPRCICIGESYDNPFWGRDNCKQNDQRATEKTPADWQGGAQSDPIWHSDEFSDARVSNEDQWEHHRMNFVMHGRMDEWMDPTNDHEWLYSKSLPEFHAKGFPEAPACIPVGI